jgi:beta-lactamase class A
MGLFGKKEEEIDEEEGFSEEEALQDRKLTRKFRDLSPENTKKRKEPPKPWGKKERIIVLIFFLFTTIAATVMFLFSHDFKFPGFPRITISGIHLKNPFAEEVIQVGQKANTAKSDEKGKKAIAFFNKTTLSLSGHYGFLVVRLTDGASYGTGSSDKFQGASLLKIPLMILMYKMSEDGNLNLDTKYTLKDSDKVKGSGVLYTEKEGTIYTYRQLAQFMGKNSDRTAYKVMKDVIGDSNIKKYIEEIGLKNTDIDTGITTPDDLGILFQKLWDGSLVNNSSRDQILEFLENTIYEKWITPGVPKNIKVAHKFGQDAGVMADGGIVLAEKPYILVIMGQGVTEQEADAFFPKISKGIYDVENSVQ